jgi:hypothetical protein
VYPTPLQYAPPATELQSLFVASWPADATPAAIENASNPTAIAIPNIRNRFISSPYVSWFDDSF